MSAKLQRAKETTQITRKASDKTSHSKWHGTGAGTWGTDKPQNLISVMLYAGRDKRKSAQLTAGRQMSDADDACHTSVWASVSSRENQGWITKAEKRTKIYIKENILWLLKSSLNELSSWTDLYFNYTLTIYNICNYKQKHSLPLSLCCSLSLST